MDLDFITYLLYGLAFFTLGVVILVQDLRFSKLEIARCLWLLAAFGITHGAHEWYELHDRLLLPSEMGHELSGTRLALANLSFGFLLLFGSELSFITGAGWRRRIAPQQEILLRRLVIAALCMLCLVCLYVDLEIGTDRYTRMCIALPAGVLSGASLILYSKMLQPLSPPASINFLYTGGCLIFYGFTAGLIPSTAVIPLLGIKIIILRGCCAMLIMLFMVRALSVFKEEQQKITDERLERFAQSEKVNSIGLLAAGIAHEINTPLANVLLNFEQLKEQIPESPKLTKRIISIERNLDRAIRIAKELLHFSREKEVVMERVDLASVVRGIEQLAANQPFFHRLRCTVAPDCLVAGIPWKLEEVMLNLLMNAADASGKDGSIVLEVFPEGEEVVIRITDHGKGIAPELRERIFDPFFTTKDVGKGTGLGLPVADSIVRQHNGRIDIASSPESGTSVSVRLPCYLQ